MSVTGHYVTWSHFGWSCECGAGRETPLGPVVRARVAAQAHQRAQLRKQGR